MIVRAENPMWSGTDTTTAQNANDIFALVAPPSTAVGLRLEAYCSAVTNNTATGIRWGFAIANSSGNVLVDVGTPVAADAIAVVFTAVATPQGVVVEIGPTFSDKNAGGGALAQGYTSRQMTLPVQFKVQKYVAGGTLTSCSWTWAVYPLYFHG